MTAASAGPIEKSAPLTSGNNEALLAVEVGATSNFVQENIGTCVFTSVGLGKVGMAVTVGGACDAHAINVKILIVKKIEM